MSSKDRELFIAISKANKDDPSAAYDQYVDTTAVVERVNKLQHEMEILRTEYEKARKNLQTAMHEAQDKCSHILTDYHPDPSGNNDSYHVCRICRKEL